MSKKQLKDNSNLPTSTDEAEQISGEWWQKIDKTIKIISPILIPLVIALMGFWGQRTITQLSVQEQNTRLYTELLSRREESESALRKDMFKEIMNGFFTEITVTDNQANGNTVVTLENKGDDIKDKLSKKILKLEMLALNFGDSLSIGPLFSELSTDVEQVLKANRDAIDNWKVVAAHYQKRLRSLAKRVASRQISTITAGRDATEKYEFDFELETQNIRKIEGEGANYNNFFWSSMDSNELEDNLKLDGVIRFFEFTVSNADLENYSISVSMKIMEMPKEINETDVDSQTPIVIANRSFSMDFFNFPLIDNTRLSHNHRFALTIESFDHKTIKLRGIIFPGSFASHRDKPFLSDAINELKENKKLD